MGTLRSGLSKEFEEYLRQSYHDEFDVYGILDDDSIKAIFKSITTNLKENKIIFVSTPNQKGFFYEMMRQ